MEIDLQTGVYIRAGERDGTNDGNVSSYNMLLATTTEYFKRISEGYNIEDQRAYMRAYVIAFAKALETHDHH